MGELTWEKFTHKGSIEENWTKIKSYLERTNSDFSRGVKFVEHNVNGEIHTTTIYPLINLPVDLDKFE